MNWIHANDSIDFRGFGNFGSLNHRMDINPIDTFIALLCAAGLVACGGSTYPTPPAGAEESPDSLHVYLLLGQSNMAGRGEVSAQDRDAHPRVFALNKAGEWELAVSPIHFDKPKVVGVGPGLAFGKTLARHDTSVRIGLVPCAVGGSSILAWQPGAVHEQTAARPYDDAIRRARIAMKSGTLMGILWYQGASDARDSMRTATYQKHLVALVRRLRQDLNAPKVPFIATRLAPFLMETYPHARRINEAISALPRLIEHVAVVSTEGLTDKGDGLHLSTASSHELGRRYAEAILEMYSRTEGLDE